MVSYERLFNIFVFSYILADFPLYQMTSDYIILCFFWPSSGETTTEVENLDLLDQALPSIQSFML